MHIRVNNVIAVVFGLVAVAVWIPNTMATESRDDTLRFEPSFYRLPRLEPGLQMTEFGPKYPLTSAWFRDRYTVQEWNQTLNEFEDAGGDTVILRAPGIRLQSRDDFISDPDFQWCQVRKLFDLVSCYDDADDELSALGLDVVAVGTYEYEEDYAVSSMIQCPAYERRYNSSRIYHRLVFSMDAVSISDPCNLNGSRVMVLFTSFAGIDAHELLLQTAHARNLSVYFGLPQLPIKFTQPRQELDFNFTIPHLEFTRRVLRDHHDRFTNNREISHLYDTLKGYFYSTDILLNSDVITNSAHRNHLTGIGEHVRLWNKHFAVSTFYISNKSIRDTPLSDCLSGFTSFIDTTNIDVISVKDGRGSGNGAYFWPTQLDTEIATADPNLFKILKAINSEVQQNSTYRSMFLFSIQEIFYKLAVIRDSKAQQGHVVDLWLNIEAFDFLHDDPCLPVDKSGSGISQIMNRVTKLRLDHVLTHAGAYVSKVTSDAWDPCFTCKASYSSSLASRVKADNGRPIIANCSFHSAFNRSVVVIGYNLLAETQGFKVTWPTTSGARQTSQVHGYYFETDWGRQHGRVPSLMYTQLYDPYDVLQLAPKGWVHVSVDGGYNSCSFTYDFTREPDMGDRTGDEIKKYYLSVKYPKPRVYGQNVPFPFQHRLYAGKNIL